MSTDSSGSGHVATETPDIESRSWYTYILLIVYSVTFFAAAIATLLMAALFAVGLHHIAKGARLAFWPEKRVLESSLLPPAPWASGLQWAIHGLEFLYLAPLAFMILYNLAKYIKSLTIPNQTERTLKIAEARGALLHVKGLGISLLIAVVATDLVGQILVGTGVETMEVISESIVIVVLAAYFRLLEKLAK